MSNTMVPIRECTCLGCGIAQPPKSPLQGPTTTNNVEFPVAHKHGAKFKVSKDNIKSAIVSNDLLGDYTRLSLRFQHYGYLAFTKFLEDDSLLESTATLVKSIVNNSINETPSDWEANLGVGSNWNPSLDSIWREIGSSHPFENLLQNEQIQELINGLADELGYSSPCVSLPQFTFVRGKGFDSGTTPHVDFYNNNTHEAGLDQSKNGFLIWMHLCGGNVKGSSQLCISPESHLLQNENNNKVEALFRDVLPIKIRESLDNGNLMWHALDEISNLSSNGTFVLMHPKVIHAATVNTSQISRISWDTRFICKNS
jgi:hypothetical protein